MDYSPQLHEILRKKDFKVGLSPYNVCILALVQKFIEMQIDGPRISAMDTCFADFLVNEVMNGKERKLILIWEEISHLGENSNELLWILKQHLDCLTSLDSIYGVFADCKNLLLPPEEEQEEPKVDYRSILGSFVEQTVAKFFSMPFEQQSFLCSITSEYVSGKTVKSELEQHHIREELFTECMKQIARRDQEGAEDSLHHHFDLFGADAEDQADIGDEWVSITKTENITNTRARISHRAALTEAALLLQMGHFLEAHAAVTETIRAAQQAEDGPCLTHALLLLAHILHALPSPGAKIQEAHLIWRCVRLGLKHSLPADIAASLVAAARLAFESDGAELTLLQSQRALDIAEGISRQHKLDNILRSVHLLRAKSMLEMGHFSLAICFSNVALSSPITKPKFTPLWFSGLAGSEVIDINCHVECMLADISGARGDFDSAISHLRNGAESVGVEIGSEWDSMDDIMRMARLDVQNTHNLPIVWHRSMLKCFFGLAIATMQYSAAHAISNRLCLLSSADVLGQTLPVHSSALLRSMDVLRSMGFGSKSCRTNGGLGLLCAAAGYTAESASHLISMAESLVESKSPQTALSHVLGCISIARDHGLSGLHSQSLILLSEILLSFGAIEQATKLCEISIPVAFEYSNSIVSGRAHLCLARCMIASNSLWKAVRPLQQALHWFTLTKSKKLLCETTYLLARVYNKLNRIEQRDEAARQFRSLVVN